MEVVRTHVPTSTLEAFAEKHGLILEVHEREYANLPRFYAHFSNTEEKDDGILIGTYGDGDTEEQATRDYARKISLKTLVIGSYTKRRREIKVPRLTR